MPEAPFDADRRCAQLSQLIESHLNHVRNQFPTSLQPLPGSPGQRDLDNEESGPGGPWGQQPVWTFISLASLRLAVAGDHLASLAKALTPPVLLFGPAALARASLENSAHVFWLLNPPLSLRDRIGRGLSQRRYSAREMNSMAPLLMDGWDDEGRGGGVGHGSDRPRPPSDQRDA